MFVLIKLLGLVLIIHSPTQACSSEVVHWLPIENDLLPQANLEAVGIENGKRIYLIQAFHFDQERNDTYNLPGKLQIIGGELRATIAVFGREYSYPEFRILSAPPRTISWIPLPTKSYISGEAVIGGNSRRGEKVYICRTKHQNDHILPGFLLESGSCYYGFNGTEQVSRSGYEILVINKLGLAMGLTSG